MISATELRVGRSDRGLVQDQLENYCMVALRALLVRLRSLVVADVESLMTAALLLAGLLLRANGFLFGTVPFWEDEAAWTMRVIDLPLSEHVIRPLGFMALSQLLAALSPSETVMRAMPWLAGVSALAMSPALARRLFSSARSRLLFVAIIALTPGAIDLAKEFKPYSVSLALHLASLLFALRYLSDGASRDLKCLLGLLFAGTLFAQDALFTYPGLFGCALYAAWQARRKEHVLALALTAVATLGLLVASYVFLWSKAVREGDGTTDYWGNKYDVFFVGGASPAQSHLAWTAQKVGEVLALPGMRRDSWALGGAGASVLGELRAIDAHVWVALALGGAVSLLLRRRRRELLLLTLPLLVAVVFNSLGKWPLGAFRTNLFALVYAAGLAASAFDGPPSSGGDWVPAGLLVVAPFLLLSPDTHARKGTMAMHSAFTEALSTLAAERQQVSGARPLLLLDGASCTPWRYYTRYHPRRAKWQSLKRQLNSHCFKSVPSLVSSLRKSLTHDDSRAFVLVTREKLLGTIESELPSDLVVEKAITIGQRDHLILKIEKRRK